MWGGWGSVTPRGAGVQGQSPAIRRALRVRRLACPLGKQPPLRGVADAHAAAQGGEKGRECYPAPYRRSPRRVSAEQRRGCATQAAQTGATCPDGAAQAEGSPRPTLIRGPRATEHLRSDRHRPTGFARLAQPPAQPAAALQRLPGCATAGARPAAALAAVWKEGGACADPRATFVE